MRPPLALVTLHPHNYGGILTLIKEAYRFSSLYFSPHLFFLSFEKGVSASLKRGEYKVKVEEKNYFGMPSTQIGARWAWWEPAHYIFTRSEWAKALDNYQYVMVVSGTPIVGHAALLTGKKYILWCASTHEDDREERQKKLSFLEKKVQSLSSFFMQQIEKKVLASASYVLGTSQYTCHLLNKVGGKAHLCPVSLPVSSLLPPEMAQKPVYLLAVGRYKDPRKNASMLIKAFALIKKQMPHVWLYVAGENFDQSIKDMKEYKDYASSIVEWGYVSEEELQVLYAGAYLFLITSHQEGLCIAGLQALSHGVPVVSTDCGGIADYVISGRSGYIVSINDARGMAGIVIELLRSPRRMSMMAEWSREIIKLEYNKGCIDRELQKAFIASYPETEVLFHK